MRKEKLSIAYISYNLPALTTTFIYREFLQLRNRGVDIRLVSLKRPDTAEVSDEVRWLIPEIIYLKPVPVLDVIVSQAVLLVRSPSRYVLTLLFAATRDTSSFRRKMRLLYHFFASAYLSRKDEIRRCDHFHSHFASGPTSVAMFTSMLLGKTYSFTAHAIDIYVDDIDIRSKISRCEFANVISNYNREHLKTIINGSDHEKLKVLYYGIDVDKYKPDRQASPEREKLSIVSIARLVEKKGHKYLVEACRHLVDRGYDFSCEIIGSGPLGDELRSQVKELGLEEYVHLPGAILQEEVLARLMTTDLFILPCVIAGDGDRDGIPNTLIEAMVMEVPVISCDVAGIGELIVSGDNGLLVQERDSLALSDAIAKMIDDAEFRRQAAVKGRKTVIEQFNIEKNTDELLSLFEEVIHKG